MSHRIWRGVVLLCVVEVIVLGCRADPPPRAPASPAAAEREVQLPDDVGAVMDVDVPQVRASALWLLVRRVVEYKSRLAATCPDVLGRARRATVALRWRIDQRAMTVFAILHGVDRASTLACLRAPHTTGLAAAEPIASAGRPLACQRYDDAVHELVRCGTVPKSLADQIEQTQALLAAASSADADGACTQALAVIERVNARRSELGWKCDSERAARGRARRFDKVEQLDPSTFLLDGFELVHFVDDHTAVTVREELHDHEELYGREERDAAQADLRALRAPRSARWYDSARASRAPRRAIWLAFDPARFDAGDRDRDHDESGRRKPPMPRITGTIDLERDVNLDLQIAGVRYEDAYGYETWLTRAAEEPMFRGVTLAATCAGPAPVGPRVERCARAIAHGRELFASQATPGSWTAGSLVEQVGTDDAVRDCIERPWPDSQLTCVNAATTAETANRCSPQRTLDSLPPICGPRPVRLRVGLPLLLVESLKLAEVADLRPRTDCRPPGSDVPGSVVVGPIELDGGETVPLAASLCVEQECLAAVDLGATHTGHNDGRWHAGANGARARCLGPFQRYPRAGHTFYRVENHCDHTLVTLELKPNTATLCRPGIDKACTSVPITGAVREVSVNTGARLAALVIGAPGAQAIETWDLTTRSRLGRFAVATTRQRPCARAQLLGDTVLVDTGACVNPAIDVTDTFDMLTGTGAAVTGAGAFLATPQGRRIAVVGGGRPPETLGMQPIFLADHRWAFVASRGDTVVIQDVASGVVERRIATGEQVEPGSVAAGADDLGHLVLVFGGTTPRAGGLALVDVANGAVRSIPAQSTCPATITTP